MVMTEIYEILFGQGAVSIVASFVYFFVGTLFFLAIYLLSGALFGRRWLHIASYVWIFISALSLSIWSTIFVQILKWISKPGQQWTLILFIPYAIGAIILNSIVDKKRSFIDIVPGRFLFLYAENIIATANNTTMIIFLISWANGIN